MSVACSHWARLHLTGSVTLINNCLTALCVHSSSIPLWVSRIYQVSHDPVTFISWPYLVFILMVNTTFTLFSAHSAEKFLLTTSGCYHIKHVCMCSSRCVELTTMRCFVSSGFSMVTSFGHFYLFSFFFFYATRSTHKPITTHDNAEAP